MKVSAAALPFLILAAALGPPAHGFRDYGYVNQGVYRAPDCCFSYTPRNIRCMFMESYYRTSSGCSQPAVVFTTKKGHKFCADPHSKSVQSCVKKLDSANTANTRKTAG